MHAIVVYHSISSPLKPMPANADVSPARFESHLQWLAKRRDRVATLEKLLNLPESDRHYAITFDDGYKDNLTTALPLLEKYELPMTLFIAAGFIGRDKYLTVDEVKKIAAHPLVTIGSHGYSHRHFPQLSSKEARFELTESKRLLEEIIEKPVDLLAWSYGDCSAELERLSAGCGYRAAWSVWNGWNTPHSRWRVPLGRNDNLPRFIAKVSPLYFPVKRFLRPPIERTSASEDTVGAKSKNENPVLQPHG